MLNFFKKNQTSLTISLDRPDGVYKPGDTVNARISLQVDQDTKFRQFYAVLACEEAYQWKYSYESRDSDGDYHTNTQTGWQTNKIEVRREVYQEEGTLEAGHAQTMDFSAELPGDAPPSVEGGHLVKVNWRLEAVIDRKMASDFNGVAPIRVLQAAPIFGSGGRMQATSMSNEPDEAEVTLEAPRLEWRPGETIQGMLKIMPHKAFDVSDVRVELERWERIPPGRAPHNSNRGYRDNGNEVQAPLVSLKVAQKTHLEPGQPVSLPFSLEIPQPAPISCETNDYSITYNLKGILARRLRGDTHGVLNVTMV